MLVQKSGVANPSEQGLSSYNAITLAWRADRGSLLSQRSPFRDAGARFRAAEEERHMETAGVCAQRLTPHRHAGHPQAGAESLPAKASPAGLPFGPTIYRRQM